MAHSWWRIGRAQPAREGWSLEALIVDSFSHFGYAREASVYELMRRSELRALFALLVRAGDWVAQERRVAQRALEALMQPPCIAAWARALRVIDRLAGVRRVDLQPLLAQIDAYLIANLPPLGAACQANDPQATRWLFRLRWQEAPRCVRWRLGSWTATRCASSARRRMPGSKAPPACAVLLRSMS